MTNPIAMLTRRQLVQGSAAVGICAAGWGGIREAHADEVASFAAHRPQGFTPLSVPGRVVKVSAKGDFASFMQNNQLWPKPEVARRLLEKALMEFTGAANLVDSLGRFISKDDVVAIKVNGIAGESGYTMATNFEVILPLVEALIQLGVPPGKLTVYEQTTAFLAGTRVNVKAWQLPAGVKTDVHGGIRMKMPEVRIYQGIATRYCSALTDATALINVSLIKDHSICGFTGTLKNVTHGSIKNPHEHHAHQASPQIALLYNHPVVTSRVRLHIADAFKIMYDKGPLDKDPKTRIPHGAIYVATDPVALDTLGSKVVEDERKSRGLKSLADSKREPRYIRVAGELGLGVHDLNAIRLKSFEI